MTSVWWRGWCHITAMPCYCRTIHNCFTCSIPVLSLLLILPDCFTCSIPVSSLLLILHNWYAMSSHQNSYVITTVTVYLFTFDCRSTHYFAVGPEGRGASPFREWPPYFTVLGPEGREASPVWEWPPYWLWCYPEGYGASPVWEWPYLGGKWWRCPVGQSHHYLTLGMG